VQILEDGGNIIKMGLKQIGFEVTGSVHLAQSRFSGDLYIFELMQGREIFDSQ
jgi:hypothetical protein